MFGLVHWDVLVQKKAHKDVGKSPKVCGGRICVRVCWGGGSKNFTVPSPYLAGHNTMPTPPNPESKLPFEFRNHLPMVGRFLSQALLPQKFGIFYPRLHFTKGSSSSSFSCFLFTFITLS